MCVCVWGGVCVCVCVCVCGCEGHQERGRWWNTGSDLVTRPAVPGVTLQRGGRGGSMLT